MEYLKYMLSSNLLYRLDNIELLENRLNLTKGCLIDNSFLESLGYTVYTNKKGRVIENPTIELKKIQRKIHNCLSEINFPEWVISCRKNVSYINNAKLHNENNYIVNLDISKFFTNCNKINTYYFFCKHMCMSKELSEIMVKLVCKDNRLPTGSPCSQILAYLSYLDMFEEIKNIAYKDNLTISLYVDDLTISSNERISNSIVDDIIKKLNENGFSINNKKRKYSGKNKNKKVTGVIINKKNQLRVPNKLRKEVIFLFKEIKSFNVNPNNKLHISKVKSLRGKLNSCRLIEPEVFSNIDNQLKKIESKLSNHRYNNQRY